MRVMHRLTVMTALVVLVGTSATARASEEMDDRIESTFRNSFVAKTYLSGQRIEIESTNGEVQLTGQVKNAMQRNMAQDTAASLPGVKGVENHLEISGTPPVALSDQWIAEQVGTALMFHRHVNPEATKVQVSDGYVTLQGEVANEDQRDLATEYAMDIDGVTGVKNEMVITKSAAYQGGYRTEPIDDASITAQVRSLLLAHRSTRQMNTSVRTNEGVVTLNGTAVSNRERDMVTRIVEDVHGVKGVVNEMNLGARQQAMTSRELEYASMVGPAGAQGPAGATGEAGARGATGAAGANIAGAAGAKGATGAVGERGATGATGATGAVVRGQAGATGAAGAEGIQGARGATGAAGRAVAGATGATGQAGREGAQGVAGATGTTGATLVGPSGPAGRRGTAGAEGATGATGERGATTVGATGATGSAGEAGTRGVAGATGSRGATGAIGHWTSYRAFWFESNSANLRSSDAEQVKEIADYLKKNPTLKVGLDGSIPAGSESGSEDWAARRVAAVRAALIKAGIADTRIETGVFGESNLARRGRVEVLLRTSGS